MFPEFEMARAIWYQSRLIFCSLALEPRAEQKLRQPSSCHRSSWSAPLSEPLLSQSTRTFLPANPEWQVQGSAEHTGARVPCKMSEPRPAALKVSRHQCQFLPVGTLEPLPKQPMQHCLRQAFPARLTVDKESDIASRISFKGLFSETA